MRIVCPSCDAAYDVPESVLNTRSMLRCARCASDFRPPQPPQAAPPAALDDDDTDHAPAEPGIPAESPAPIAPAFARPPARPAPQPEAITDSRRKQILAAWAGSLVVIVAAIWLGISHRRSVMQAWPPSIRLYAVFGAQPP